MIYISKIEFINYRQYRNISIDFPKSDRFNLHVLKAKNGTGKTTLLNGILWCFYGKEHYISNKEKALPIINSKLVEESEDKKKLETLVRISLYDDEKLLVFERIQHFIVNLDPLRNKNNVMELESKLTITITENNESNSVVLEDDDEVSRIVKQYFDESIFDYYFFDGENLKSYFAKGKGNKIQDSIYNISQVTLLKNASTHVGNMATEKYRQSSNIKADDKSLLDDKIELEKNIEKLKEENKQIDINMPKWQSKVDEADDFLLGYAPIRNNQLKRNEYQDKLKVLEKEYSDLFDERNQFVREYIVLLNFYPRFKSIYNLIIKKEKDGNLPPNIDKKQIQNMLNNHVKNCPVCNGVIGENAIAFLNNLLDKLDVSSETSNYLMSIKTSLETLIEKAELYPEEKDRYIQQEKYLKDEIERINKELNRLSAFLSNYSNDNDTIDVSKIERDRKYYLSLINNNTAKKAANEKDIDNYTERLERIYKELDSIETKKSNKDTLTKQVVVLRKMNTYFDKVKDIIMKEIKNEIQKNTWNCFESMIWKTNTFGKVSINDSYEISVLDKFGKEISGSMSATELMALAYSFTLAIHEVSGKNCPLVVDSPLGRVSDDNRANMASELLRVSMDKQIIMLFTPDEYSLDVRKIYDSSACTIREISLTEDETMVGRVGN